MTADSHRRGYLIVFEGIDGVGKSTHIKRLSQHLEEKGFEVVTDFEPTYGQWGKKLRESATTGRLPMNEEIDLFLKDRREHVELVIAPAIAAGKVILLDRYYLSMMAYQGARGADVAAIRKANEEFAPIPDAVVWLDLPVERALERIGSRGACDSFEKKESLEACRNIFASVTDSWMYRVDCDAEIDVVTQRIADVVDSVISK